MAKDKKGFAAEFKEFIMRGNVLDLAVGVIIGGAFQAIVSSLVDDIIMPVLGLILGKIDFSALAVKIPDPTDANNILVEIAYGKFIGAIINFLIMAFIIFLIVKGINSVSNKLKKPEEEAPATTKVCPYCQSEVSIKAVKCPHCTSDLEVEEE